MLKGLTWGLLGFSALAVVGMLFSPADEGTAWGILYAGLVVAQGTMVLMRIKEDERDHASKKVI